MLFSIRTDEQAVLQWCDVFDYTPVCFTAKSRGRWERMEIYHTNVMMCIAINMLLYVWIL